MKQVLLSFICLFILVGCAHDVPFAYKMDIQQGNVLKPEDVEKVKVGMNKSQVAQLLGDPISRDSFKQGRWDYVYYLKKNHKPADQRHVSVIFNDQGLVSHIERPVFQKEIEKETDEQPSE